MSQTSFPAKPFFPAEPVHKAPIGQVKGSNEMKDNAGADHSAKAFALESDAHELADRLPDLVLEALRITNTVTHGIHGRRRAGPGETFWQFRQYGDSDSATQIDWRRSASSDHLFVREREWEAAHTVWLWSNLSDSMRFQSHLSTLTKRDRAVVLMLAVGELLVRGGERIALLGLTRPSASRKTTTHMAEALAGAAASNLLDDPQPPSLQLNRFTGTILFSDFLEPLDEIGARLNMLAAEGVSGHLVQILDPAEETLPYQGRAEFSSMDGRFRWVADRAESLSARYREKLLAQRAGLEDLARQLGWSFMVHHTDRPAAEPLLALTMRLQGLTADYRWNSGSESRSGSGPQEQATQGTPNPQSDVAPAAPLSEATTSVSAATASAPAATTSVSAAIAATGTNSPGGRS